jgi:hypothetical protein
MNPTIHLPVEHYLKLIKSGIPFSMSRFGDGEAICMFHNWLKVNCDGSRFLPELIEPMKQIFRNQYPYYHCLLRCSFDLNGDKFLSFLEETCPDMDFFDGEIWQDLSFSGRIGELIEAINPYHPVFVGAEHIHNVQYMHGITDMSVIEVPSVDAFKKFNEIFNEVMRVHAMGKKMFLFSAGYSTKPLIDTLFPYIGHDTFMIDVGSLFDPYCGKLSRDGMVASGFEKFQPFTKMKL